MRKLIMGLATIGLSKALFEWMNLTTMTKGSLMVIAGRTLRLAPLQVLGGLGFAVGFSWTYSAIGDRIWLLLLLEEAMNFGIKVAIRGAIFKQPIELGSLVGLGLCILGCVAAVVIK